MTVVEKAAYLKGLVEGLGIEAESKEGKLWGALNDLLHDMAHEIEDLHACNMDYAEALDEMAEELSYLEELTCDLDMPEDFEDECDGDCDCCDEDCDCCDDEDDDIEYYEIQCPHCNEIVVLDDSIDPSSIKCPACGKEFNAGE